MAEKSFRECVARLQQQIEAADQKAASEREASVIHRIPPPNPAPNGSGSFSFPKGWMAEIAENET